MNNSFYVWNEAHGSPTFCHATLDGAVKEAERLARRHPGQTFRVLAVMGIAHQPAPPSLYTPTPLGLDAGVPF